MSEGNKIKNVIDTIFSKNNRLSKTYNQFTVEEVWRSVFGEVISSYTTKVLYKNEILTLYINSSPLKEEINLNKESIILKLNNNLTYKKVKDIIVR